MVTPKRKKNGAALKDASQCRAANIHEEITAFEEFKREILPAIRADIKKGVSDKELRKKYAALLEARKITIALSSMNEGAALTAIKDVQDRSEGRASEKKEITHRYENLPENEIDAVLTSEISDLKEILN